MIYYAYCSKCLAQPKKTDKEFYDFRFETPTCFSCVEEYDLQPEQEF